MAMLQGIDTSKSILLLSFHIIGGLEKHSDLVINGRDVSLIHAAIEYMDNITFRFFMTIVYNLTMEETGRL